MTIEQKRRCRWAKNPCAPGAARWRILVFSGLALLLGCDSEPTDEVLNVEDFITNATLTHNPSGYAPLTAELNMTTSRRVQVELLIAGRSGEAAKVQHRFEGARMSFKLPVLGLYASMANTIVLRFYDEGGAYLGETSRAVTTGTLPIHLPRVTIEATRPGRKPGMNLVSYFGRIGEAFPQIPFFFDSEGAVRWYLDVSEHPTLSNLFFDVGIERLANGNLFFGDINSERIVEMDMLGRVVREWLLDGYGFHHSVIEMPNGNFLATVSKHGLSTVEDFIIEIDRSSGAVLQEWDLRRALDSDRRAWTTNTRDWMHANGLVYDPTDDAIIVSGRTQGTVKLTRDNEVVWILAPHRGWMTAGDGADLRAKLLQPLDAAGRPITDPDVLEGTANHADFEWAWYQHAPEMLPDGTLALFDNGPNRNFSGRSDYSRAVIYRIDESAMTIAQVWQYGKERGGATFSSIVSDVDYHVEDDNVVFMPGASRSEAGAIGKTIEVDRLSRAVIFEATIRPPTALWGITFHRVERLPLYAPQ